MDIFRVISELKEVEIVRNLYQKHATEPLDLIFFTCPRMGGSRWRSRIRVNELGTGLSTTYREGVSEDSLFKVERAKDFALALTNAGINIGSLINVLGTADALILFSPPVSPPTAYRLKGVETIPNYEIVLRHLDLWAKLYRKRPWWQSCPRWAREMEENRLRGLLPRTIPENLAADFILRVFAGFALDGILIRNGEFGTRNPVILGVESAGVVVLQNAALPKEQWLPVIQLHR